MNSKNLKDIYVGVKKNDEDRRTNDLYETPPLATYILHKYTSIPKNVVEPCAGRGNISKELIRNGYNVLSYDLNSYENSLVDIQTNQDVLILPKQEGFDAFITNPPYFQDLPRKIAMKGISEYDYTALFVRLTYLEGMKRKIDIFDKHKPTDIIFLSDRIRFRPNMTEEPVSKKDQIGGMIAYMWIVWDKRKQKENTELRWVLLDEEYPEWFENYKEKNI